MQLPAGLSTNILALLTVLQAVQASDSQTYPPHDLTPQAVESDAALHATQVWEVVLHVHPGPQRQPLLPSYLPMVLAIEEQGTQVELEVRKTLLQLLQTVCVVTPAQDSHVLVSDTQ